MARETKVGLLAGLAFIICFAVILANRGANAPSGLVNSYLPNGGLELPKLVQRNQASTADTVANPNRNRNQPAMRQPLPEPPSNPAAHAGIRQPDSQHAMMDSVPATGAQLAPATGAELAPQNHERALAQNIRPVDLPTPAIANSELERATASRSRSDSALRNETIVPMIATTSQTSDPISAPGRVVLNEQAPLIPANAQPTAPIQGTPYTVKASDTLSSIASAHYGTKSKRAVETIFDANRSVLTDINNVKSGMVLLIPRFANAASEKTQFIEKSQSPAKSTSASGKLVEAKGRSSEKSLPEKPDKKATEKASVKKVAETVAEGEKNPRNFQWYQVKKNDRFASIAREQLGDAGRWQEVYELNKDKFPDPQHIREGVRIKLPGNNALASAGKEKGR